MNILTQWLRTYVPGLDVSDRQLADDLTLRGIAVEGVHDLGPGNGSLFEMDITTNRVDAMNHYGIAREVATIYDLPLSPLDTTLPAAKPGPAFAVSIDAPDLCGRFTARVIRGVTIAPSTGHIAETFSRLGLKSISNAVDASNVVLHRMGHPTHAFDLDKIEGGVIVRLARMGERLKLLDGTDRVLEADDLVIADHVKALSLAGVMGGWDSMITPETKNILVEAAWFDPVTIRRSSRRHLLHTDASHRFERGADFNACATANALVSKLIIESGGTIEGEFADIIIPQQRARTADRPAISLSISEVQRRLGRTVEDTPSGSALTAERVQRYLTSLGCQLTATSLGTFSVKLPSWRLDLEREIDLIEEVARVYGYNRFADTLPTALPIEAHPLAAKEAAVRARLLALGYSEAISSSFASRPDGTTFAGRRGSVALENPLSEEAGILRPSLLPGMLAMLAYNLNRDVREVRLFEQGTVFTGSTTEVREVQGLALGLTGTPHATSLHIAKDAGIFELKGTIESLLSLFAASPEDLSSSAAAAVTFSTQTPPWIEPGRGAVASLNGREIAWFGELATAERETRKLRQPVYVAEIDVQAPYALPLRRATAREISRYQAVERDFSFTFGDAVQWHAIEQAVNSLGIPELTRLAPVEIFRDSRATTVPGGHHALLLRCVFQSPERTLREDELSRWSAQVIDALTKLGGVLRA
ncbi:MAG TPA: phenylalanine--tRNA ligase subunit beta [Acidobacteriaceae bacterium]|nr:phenylalanine--tRNA ligase subunit beta [Acidobacteriaceae bacterium]